MPSCKLASRVTYKADVSIMLSEARSGAWPAYQGGPGDLLGIWMNRRGLKYTLL